MIDDQLNLVELIGEEATFAFTDQFAGMRLYIPLKLPEDHEIVDTIGVEATNILIARLGGDVIRVPLARELRTRFYDAQGMSKGKIAHRLGMTETGVDKMFARMRAAGWNHTKNRQLDFGVNRRAESANVENSP